MDLESLKREINRLKTEKAAFQAQSRLLENFVTMVRSSAQGEMLKGTLQKTLEVAIDLSGADKGSLFLLDDKGAVTDSILTRKETTQNQRSQLIGSVLDKGLAGWVSRTLQVGVITDTATDDRWLTLPDQPYEVRSALAVPILRGDKLMGILTLLHPEPGHFSPKSTALMQATAAQMAITLENARLYAELDESYRSLGKAKQAIESYSKVLKEELEKGRQIQKNFLPGRLYQPQSWEIAACFHPASQLSGDFYDVFPLPGDYVGLVIADVCDKGVGAALFMALFRSLIRIFSGQISLSGLSIVAGDEGLKRWIENQKTTRSDQINPLTAVSLTNDYIAQEHGQMCMFATLFFGVLNPADGLLAYVNGGHEPLFIIGPSGIKQSLRPTGPAAGIMCESRFAVQQRQIEPGDILLGFTDGVTEACSPSGEFFTKRRLQALLNQPAFSASDLLERVKTSLFTHIQEAPQSDDITMLAVQRLHL